MGSVAIPSSGGGGFGKNITRSTINFTNNSGWMGLQVEQIMPEAGSVTFTKTSGSSGITLTIYKNGIAQSGTVSFSKGDTIRFYFGGINNGGAATIQFSSDLMIMDKTININWVNSSGSGAQTFVLNMKKDGYMAYSTSYAKAANAVNITKNGTSLSAISASFAKNDTIQFFNNMYQTHNAYIDWLY